MCKNSGIILSEKKEEIKKGCGGDCKRCPFGKVFSASETDMHRGLPDTVKDIEKLIISSDE